MCCISSSVLAQNSKFSGPYAQFGIGYQTASPSFSNTSLSAAGQTLTPTVSVSNASGFTGTVAAGYNFFSGTPLLLGLGIEYTPFPTSNATASASYSGSVGTYQNSASVRVNNSLNIFIAPGLALDQNKLLYGKMGYTGSSANGVNTDFIWAVPALVLVINRLLAQAFMDLLNITMLIMEASIAHSVVI